MMRRTRISILTVLAIGAGLLAGTVISEKPTIPILPARDFAKAKLRPVVRVIDGDTIVIDRDGEKVTVRLIGVNAPETTNAGSAAEAYGQEASRFLTNLLKGEGVYVFLDSQQDKKDRYGRYLGHVYRAPDGLFVNAEIIRQGYAYIHPGFPFKLMKQFRQLEQFAIFAQKGLWAPRMPRKIKPIIPKPALTIKQKRLPALIQPSPQPGPSISPSGTGKTVYVRGYYRKNGTYVRPHYRRPPRRRR